MAVSCQVDDQIWIATFSKSGAPHGTWFHPPAPVKEDEVAVDAWLDGAPMGSRLAPVASSATNRASVGFTIRGGGPVLKREVNISSQ